MKQEALTSIQSVSQSSSRNKNYSLCTFQNGKIYNCDLSAAQNIGATEKAKVPVRGGDAPAPVYR